MSNLTIRILVAVVGIPLIILLAMAGGFYFFAFVALVSALALHEFYRLAELKGAAPQVATGIVFGVGVNAVFLHGKLSRLLAEVMARNGVAIPLPSMTQAFLIVFMLFVFVVLLIELFRNRGSALANIGATVLGVAYVSLFLGSFIGLRELYVPSEFPVYAHFTVPGPTVPDDVAATIDRWGGMTVMAVFASIWICDTAAFSVGRKLGRHKLFERVSPRKTWEGAIAGFIFAIGSFILAREVALPYLSLVDATLCGCIVGVFGQIGDLAESLLKRDAGVKDSSSMIPGHGGVLDRFDSLLFVAPLVFLYLDFLVF